MKEFAKKALTRLKRMPREQLETLTMDIAEENEFLLSVVDSLNSGLIICDADWLVLKANKAAERYVPFYRTDNREQVWSCIDDLEISGFLKECSVNKKSLVSDEFTVSTSGGSTRIITITVQPYVQRKKMAGYIIRIDDITETRSQEVKLRRMESLASLTSLAASVAHEIKNPLGAISIHIQLIQKALKKARAGDGKLPDEKFVENYLDIVTQEIERLNQIIVDFLFAVRPVQASLELVNLSEMLENFCQFIVPELDNKKISLEKDLLEKPPYVYLDTKLFKQVLINLAQNAIAAMKDGGKLLVSTKLKNDRLLVAIADTGCGMDAETVSRIFEPYFTTKANGTGLGLTMVYKIIKELGGDIDVKSFPDEGTIFTISLPVPQKELRALEYQGS